MKRCRRQTSEIEQDQKDWEERNKAMKAEKEHQQRKDSQQTKPESSETSGEGPSTSVDLKRGGLSRSCRWNLMNWPRKSHKTSPEVRDESERKEESTQQEKTETESDNPPIEFEDQMYELMQEAEMMTEYQGMTSEQEEELILQLTPRERAEYWEMREHY